MLHIHKQPHVSNHRHALTLSTHTQKHAAQCPSSRETDQRSLCHHNWLSNSEKEICIQQKKMTYREGGGLMKAATEEEGKRGKKSHQAKDMWEMTCSAPSINPLIMCLFWCSRWEQKSQRRQVCGRKIKKKKRTVYYNTTGKRLRVVK